MYPNLFVVYIERFIQDYQLIIKIADSMGAKDFLKGIYNDLYF